MQTIYEMYGPEFVISGKNAGWHIGRWKTHNCLVLLKPVNDTDFVFCTLIPENNHQFDPVAGVPNQTWYFSISSLHEKFIEISRDGVQALLEARCS